MKKRIIVVGNYRDKPAEGMEVITKKLVDELTAEDFNVKPLSSWEFLLFLPINLLLYKSIIFTHGPGKGAYILTVLISIFSKAKVTWVATRPKLGANLKANHLLSSLKTVYFTKKNSFFTKLKNNCNTDCIRIVIGADFERLMTKQTDKATTRELLLNDNSNNTAPLLLHVGHLRKNRGLTQLVRIKSELKNDVEILVVSGNALSQDQEVIRALKNAGIHIFSGYLENIGDVYRAADIYLFPLNPSRDSAIDLPLSVIEALALGVPVVSTPYGALAETLVKNKNIKLTGENFSEDFLDLVKFGVIPAIRRFKSEPLPNEFNINHLVKMIVSNEKSTT